MPVQSGSCIKQELQPLCITLRLKTFDTQCAMDAYLVLCEVWSNLFSRAQYTLHCRTDPISNHSGCPDFGPSTPLPTQCNCLSITSDLSSCRGACLAKQPRQRESHKPLCHNAHVKHEHAVWRAVTDLGEGELAGCFCPLPFKTPSSPITSKSIAAHCRPSNNVVQKCTRPE